MELLLPAPPPPSLSMQKNWHFSFKIGLTLLPLSTLHDSQREFLFCNTWNILLLCTYHTGYISWVTFQSSFLEILIFTFKIPNMGKNILCPRTLGMVSAKIFVDSWYSESRTCHFYINCTSFCP